MFDKVWFLVGFWWIDSLIWTFVWIGVAVAFLVLAWLVDRKWL